MYRTAGKVIIHKLKIWSQYKRESAIAVTQCVYFPTCEQILAEMQLMSPYARREENPTIS
jgi:hypothetical protein